MKHKKALRNRDNSAASMDTGSDNGGRRPRKMLMRQTKLMIPTMPTRPTKAMNRSAVSCPAEAADDAVPGKLADGAAVKTVLKQVGEPALHEFSSSFGLLEPPHCDLDLTRNASNFACLVC